MICVIVFSKKISEYRPLYMPQGLTLKYSTFYQQIKFMCFYVSRKKQRPTQY